MAAVSPLLETRRLSRRFGGLQAVAGVDLRIAPGEVRALIGPNGAGKTTLVGLISGRIPATTGQVLFSGRDITGLPAWDRVALGIVYTFQITSVYRKLSVRDNLLLAAQRRRLRGVRDWLAFREATIERDVAVALDTVGLGGLGERRAGELAYGHQRLLEVAMALALRPSLLILDEPTQGLAAAEIEGFCRLVRDIASTATVLLIEHNVSVVLELASRITVMERGRVIAEGSPRDIEANAEVQRAYLGPRGVS
jgi:branched-chain amino acid transport system ATP-binding protein